MSGKQLDFRIQSADGAKTATVEGIPADLWQRFTERANEIMPEKAPSGWASVLAEVIADIGGGGQTHTLIMTDIPAEAVVALDELAADVDMSADGLIAQLYRYAQGDSLHLVRMLDGGDPSHLLMLYGIPQRHWDAWRTFSRSVDQTPESMFGLLLQLVEQGAATVTRNEHGRKPTATVAANGDGPRARRTKQPAAGPD